MTWPTAIVLVLTALPLAGCGKSREDPGERPPSPRDAAAREPTGEEALAQRLAAAVKKGGKDELRGFLNKQRYLDRILAANPGADRRFRSYAKGASDVFGKGNLFDSLISRVQAGGEFTLVKLYAKGSSPVLQFRLQDSSGLLYYYDFYTCREKDGAVGIEDFQNYDSGDLGSRQIRGAYADLGKIEPHLPQLQKATSLIRDDKLAEAYACLKSLPENKKQVKIFSRQLIMTSFQADPSRVEELLADYRRRFPGDPSAVFLEWHWAVGREDHAAQERLAEEIWHAVGGDELLLWWKARAIIAQGKFPQAAALLSEMKEKHGVAVEQKAESELPASFRESPEFRAWAKGSGR